MKKLILLLPVILLTTIFNTSCNKDEEPPAPQPVVTTTPTPTPVQIYKTFIKRVDWSVTYVHLTVKTQSQTVVLSGDIASSTSPVGGYINEGEQYIYELRDAASNIFASGNFSVSSTGALSFQDNPPLGVIGLELSLATPPDIVFYEI
ncbi:MAG: hypothetical protein J5I47_03145 [Vicingus serpentipes]|nr:hypothetical protein [Vicingus serpentipes]